MTDCNCEYDKEFDTGHMPSCKLATVTKGEVVELIRNGAVIAIEDYQFWLGDGNTPDEAKQAAIEGSGESLSCYLGLGSCGGGGCKH